MRTQSVTKKDIAPRIVCTVPWRLTMVKPLANYMLEVEFVDGTHGIVNMKRGIMSSTAGIFAQLQNIDLFNQVYLEYGAVTWPGEIDLAPDTMYDEIKKDGTWILR